MIARAATFGSNSILLFALERRGAGREDVGRQGRSPMARSRYDAGEREAMVRSAVGSFWARNTFVGGRDGER